MTTLILPNEAVGADAGPAALFIKHQEPPEDFMRRLREVSPIQDVVSWLQPNWHMASQRWFIYECVPIRYVHDNELISDLAGPDKDSPEGQRLGVMATPFQQKMFREHRVHARLCWVVQGDKGGHQYVYGEAAKELCRARGLPTEPPEPGALPYAPLDERVITQMIRMSKLVQNRMSLSEFKKRHGNVESWKREKREELRAARAEYVRFLNDQLEYGDDLIARGVKKGEVDDAPRVESDFVEENEKWDEKYIQSGLLNNS